ncbi:hypothetical protein RQP46_007099 [Phenoliferia psychrophenolica]
MSVPTPVVLLPRITIQESFPTVVSEIRDGTHAAEDIWCSVYRDGETSVHGRVRVTEGEEDKGDVELTARDGVEVTKVSNTELNISCPALKVAPTTTLFPLATPFSLRGGIDVVALSEKGGRWVVGGKDGAVRVGDVRGDRRTIDLQGHVADIRAVAFFPSGEVVLTASSDMSVRVFSAVDGTNPRTLTGHTKAVTGLAILGVGRLVASCSLDGSLRIWNVATSTTATHIRLTQPITSLAIGPAPTPPSPSSPPTTTADLPPNLIALLAHTNGSCSLLALDEPATSRTITTLDAGSSPLFAVAYDPVNALVATGARDGTVSLFLLPSPNSPSPITTPSPTSPSTISTDLTPIMSFRRSSASITSLAFSPSSTGLPTLLVGSSDGLPFRAALLEVAPGTIEVTVKEEYAGGDCESAFVVEAQDRNVWIATGEGKLRRYKAGP